MAKLVHLKKQNGASFHVTPHAFEHVIKKDKNWRKHYDYVGEIEEEEVGTKSESAIDFKNPPIENKPIVEKVKNNEVEETNETIFNTNNHEQEEPIQSSTDSGKSESRLFGKSGKGKSGKK